MEPLLLCVVKYLLSLHAFKDGVVIDSGANDGSSAIVLAALFPRHTVIAIEPLKANIEIRAKVSNTNVTNVRVLQAGLGDVAGVGSYPSRLDQERGSLRLQLMKSKDIRGNLKYPVLTVDQLISKRTLSFAHWDVEGSEPMVLEGARATISRDRPVFTVETHRLHMRNEHGLVMQQVQSLNYTAHEIEEVCGG